MTVANAGVMRFVYLLMEEKGMTLRELNELVSKMRSVDFEYADEERRAVAHSLAVRITSAV